MPPGSARRSSLGPRLLRAALHPTRVIKFASAVLFERGHWSSRPWAREVAFICGCGHSGTTLTAVVLSEHPDIFVPMYETHAFASGDQMWPRLRTMRQAMIASGRPILVEKTPFHVRRMALIRRLVPGAKFILLVRDGRDVTASIAKRYDGNFVKGLNRWIADNEIVQRETGRDDVCTVRYEDIVTDPAAAFSRVCAFLGVTFQPEMLEYHRRPRQWSRQTEVVKGTGAEGVELARLRHWQVSQPLFDGRGRWAEELPADILREFTEGHAHDLMVAFRYLPGGAAPDGRLVAG